MNSIERNDISRNASRVTFRLEGYGKVNMSNGIVDTPDLARECKLIMQEYSSQIDGHPDTYTALTLIDRYGGRILEVEADGINVRIT